MSEETFDECIICGEPLKTRILLPCDHYNFCIKCFERLSLCYQDKKCPFCQREVTSDPIITHAKQLGTYATESLKRRQHDNFYHVFFDTKEDIKAVANLRKVTCQECGEMFNTFGQLKNHVEKTHKKQVCQICFESKRFLPCEATLYTKQQYRFHIPQHPKCPVCKFVGFDQNILNVHMRENHFRCDICAAQGKESWFESLELIEVHFHTDHFACEDPMCVMQGFIVFATKTELLMHKIQVHGAKPSILNEAKDEDEKEPKDDEDVHQRHLDSKKKFKAATKREFAGQPKKSFDLENIIYQVDNRKISVSDFCEQYKKITGESADKLFVETVSIIFTPEIRAEVVKGLQGIRGCTVPKMQEMKENFPTLDEKKEEEKVDAIPVPLPLPQRPRNDRKPKKPKKIIVSMF